MPEPVDAESVRFEALDAVVNYVLLKKPEPEYVWRSIKRWYSSTYSTPMAEVDKIPESDILTHYWESHYESMDAAQLEEVVLAETRGHDKVAEAKERDDAYHARIEREELEKLQKKGAKPAAKAAPAPPPPKGRTEFFDPTNLDSLGAAAQEVLDMIPGISFRQSPEG